MKKYAIIILTMLVSLAISAADAAGLKKTADAAYTKGDYRKAEQCYLKLSKMGESSIVSYNLGCTYYRMDNIAKSVLWFERAARLDPSDDDIRFNLDMARSKTIDRITPRHEMFFISWWNSLMLSLSVSQWAYLATAAFAVMLVLFGAYIYLSGIMWRKISFFGSMLSLLFVILFNIMAWSLRSRNDNRMEGIIMSPAVVVKSTPDKSGTDLFVIHEGTKIVIRDNTLRDWVEVVIADGKVGWVRKDVFETI